MEDRRRNRRMELDATLMVKRLDDGGKTEEVAIETFDLSKTGIGFYCDEELSSGGMYETYLTIWTKEIIHCFIEIVRVSKQAGRFSYGAIFIGMSETDAQRIQVYQTIAQMNGEDEE